MYKVNLTGYDTIQARRCASASCTVVFTELPASRYFYDLIVLATNSSYTLKEFKLIVGKLAVRQ